MAVAKMKTFWAAVAFFWGFGAVLVVVICILVWLQYICRC